MFKSTLISSFAASLIAAFSSLHAAENMPADEIAESPATPVFYDAQPELILDKRLSLDSSASNDIDAKINDSQLNENNTPNLSFDRNLNTLSMSERAFDRMSVPEGGVIIEGDKLNIYLDRSMQSIGHASIHDSKQDIYGDRIDYDMQNDELHAINNVRIESAESNIEGSELRLVLGDNTGEMQTPIFTLNPQAQPQTADNLFLTDITQNRDAAINLPRANYQQSSSRGDASAVIFEGESKKRLKNVRFTTCEAGSNDWYIKAGDLEIDNQTQTATGTNAQIEFKGMPILYSPWIDFSFSSQRKSGVLAPSFGTTSRSGFEFLVPYYLNLSPNMDATLGTRLLSKRGLQLQGEFRYLNPLYSGTDVIEYLPSDEEIKQDRYYVNFAHTQTLGAGWSFGYNAEQVSDDQYFADLSTRITVTSRVNLLQQAYVNYGDEIWTFNGLVQKYQTLDQASFPYQRLPQLTLNGSKDWNMVSANLSSQWVSFSRDNDAPTIVTGNRFTAYPSVSFPLAKPYGYITPKLGVHYSNYSLENVDAGSPQNLERTLPIFSLDSSLYFDREMRIVDNTYTQTLEPRAYYVYIPEKDQSLFPVFDTGNSDLNLGTLFQENQFTGSDRINDANQLSLALSTRLVDSKTGIQRLAATIGKRYYFSDQTVSLPNSTTPTSKNTDLVAALTAALNNHWDVDVAWQYNVDDSTTIRNNLGARYSPEPGKVLNLSYRYTQDRLEQINFSGQWPLGSGWYGMGRWNYSLRESQPIEGLIGLEYDAGCWQTRTVIQRTSTATADANYGFFFQIELGGLSSIGSNPLTLLQRSIPGYTTTGKIPDQYKQSSYE